MQRRRLAALTRRSERTPEPRRQPAEDVFKAVRDAPEAAGCDAPRRSPWGRIFTGFALLPPRLVWYERPRMTTLDPKPKPRSGGRTRTGGHGRAQAGEQARTQTDRLPEGVHGGPCPSVSPHRRRPANHDNNRLIPKHGGYPQTKTRQLADLINDVTVRFCDKYVDPRSRTLDQIVQAARSGAQNLQEGSMDSAISKKIELKRT